MMKKMIDAAPKGVQNPKRIAREYNATLQKLVRLIRKDINENLMPLVSGLSPFYTRDAWSDDIVGALRAIMDRWASPRFRGAAEQIAGRFVTSADQWNKRKFDDDMKRFGVNVFNDAPDLADYLNLSTADNVSLIQSIPDQYLKQVESVVMTNVRAGGRPADIEKLLRDQFGVTERRAKMIARDQTSKINSNLAQKRQQAAGFEYFQWVDSGDSRVRDRHEAIADKVTAYGKGVYRYDNPPMSDKGVPILPGEDYQCRCVARPVPNSQVERNQAAGNVRKGVYR